MKSEIRKDYIQERYVIISPQRGRRPHDIERPEIINHRSNKSCSFCAVKVDKKQANLTIGPKKNWYVKVIDNHFPAVEINNPKAYGKQEVIIETSNHITELDDLPLEHITKVFDAYAHRTRELSKDSKIEYILTFKNNGGQAGASLLHSHSQVFATAFLPPNLFDRSQKALAYQLAHGKSIWLDIIEKEKKSRRYIWHDENVIAFTPYASFHNYEVWIMPFKQRDNITQLTKEEKYSTAKILRHLLRKIGSLQLPYNYYFHEIIHDKNQHFCIQITPRGNVWSGVEIGSGLIINPIAPEEAAAHYRHGLKI